MGKSRVIDPTENVIALVKAGRKADKRFQDGMRNDLDKRLSLHADYIHRLKTQEFSMQDAARMAESKRIDEQLRLRDQHDREKFEMTSRWTETTATAFSTALNAVQKTSNERLDRLEKFMYEQSGKGAGLSAGWGVIVGLGGLAAAAVGIAAFFLKG